MAVKIILISSAAVLITGEIILLQRLFKSKTRSTYRREEAAGEEAALRDRTDLCNTVVTAAAEDMLRKIEDELREIGEKHDY